MWFATSFSTSARSDGVTARHRKCALTADSARITAGAQRSMGMGAGRLAGGRRDVSSSGAPTRSNNACTIATAVVGAGKGAAAGSTSTSACATALHASKRRMTGAAGARCSACVLAPSSTCRCSSSSSSSSSTSLTRRRVDTGSSGTSGQSPRLSTAAISEKGTSAHMLRTQASDGTGLAEGAAVGSALWSAAAAMAAEEGGTQGTRVAPRHAGGSTVARVPQS